MMTVAFIPIVVALILNLVRKSEYRLWSLGFAMAATIVGVIGTYFLNKSNMFDSSFFISLVFAGAGLLLAIVAIALSLVPSSQKSAKQPKVSGVTAILVAILSAIGTYFGLILLLKYLNR